MQRFGSVAVSPSGQYAYVNNELEVYQYDLWAEDIAGSQLLIAEIRDKAESLNIPVSDLFKEVAKTPRKRGGSVKPKYRNPGDKTQTWTGRGLKPRWVRDLLDSGKSLEDIAI